MTAHALPLAASDPIPMAASRQRPAAPFRDRPIGEILVATGDLSAANLDRALVLQRSVHGSAHGARIGTILLAEHMVSAKALAMGLALQQGVRRLRVTPDRASGALIDLLGADICLRHGILPWRQTGIWTIVATSRPDAFETLRDDLEARLGPVRMALADEDDLREAILAHRSGWLTARAETRCPEAMSVRRWGAARIGAVLVAGLLALVAAMVLAPGGTTAALTLWAVICLGGMTALKVAAALAVMTPRRAAAPSDAPLPRISLLVPLLSEAGITAHLLDRLGELDYPAALLDVTLIVEAGDGGTQAALTRSILPATTRIVTVPRGTIRTKPRAMNYALDFCRGDVVGIYDAEDAPEPDQLRKVAAALAAAPRDVVCLQGTLAFYNARQNWLARCFAIDYAAWFRVVLPGLARLGFVIPLGGTTLFFRREALEALGRWDAHNVTEDADLGIRLARKGWRADIVETVTREEANCAARPWVRQRARWLKGYALTWAVHMRRPLLLLRELGPKRFIGVQVMFLGTVSLFLLAPLLWTFWLLPLGLWHPLGGLVPGGVLLALGLCFLAAEAVNMAVASVGVLRNGDRWLLPWVPTMVAYFPLAAIACWRALFDCIRRPFFWDKTAHGHSLPAPRAAAVRRIIRRVAETRRGRAGPAELPRAA